MSVSSASFSVRATIYDAKMYRQTPPEPKQPVPHPMQTPKAPAPSQSAKISVVI